MTAILQPRLSILDTDLRAVRSPAAEVAPLAQAGRLQGAMGALEPRNGVTATTLICRSRRAGVQPDRDARRCMAAFAVSGSGVVSSDGIVLRAVMSADLGRYRGDLYAHRVGPASLPALGAPSRALIRWWLLGWTSSGACAGCGRPIGVVADLVAAVGEPQIGRALAPAPGRQLEPSADTPHDLDSTTDDHAPI